MNVHTIRVCNRQILFSDRKIVANGQNSDYITLKLDDEWEGRRVLIVLGSGYDSLVCEYKGDPVPFPNALLQTPGNVPVSIVGYFTAEDGTESRIVTAQSEKSFEIIESGALPAQGQVI